MTDPFAEDLANKGLGAPVDDPFAADLARKGLTAGLTPERKTQLEAKHAKNLQEIEALKAEQNAPDNNYIAAGIRGGAAGLSDVADKATLGLYKKGRNAALSRLSPDLLKTIQGQESEFHAPVEGSPAMRRVQQMAGALGDVAGYGTGLGGLASKAGGAIAKGLGGGVAAQAIGGAASGGLTAGAEASIGGADRGESAKRAGLGALTGGAIGAAAGAVGKFLGGAPARAAESELAGLKEGVQNKTRIGKFVPREPEIRAELATEPVIRRTIKGDPGAALPQVKQKLKTVANDELEPFYRQMTATGQDGVAGHVVENNLKAVRAGFNKYAEKGQVAVVDDLIDTLAQDAAANGGKIPAQTLRETATAFQGQGHANLPMFGQIPLSKEAKQDIGNALRGAVADHVESLTGNTASGKALREAFVAANKKVSTWYAIHDILEEKVKRERGGAPAMADIVKHTYHAMKHPIMAALPFVEPAAEGLSRKVIAPAVSSAAGRALTPAARAAGTSAPAMGVGMLQEAAQEKKRRDEEAARQLTEGF